MANPREYTCRLLEMVDDGILSAADVMHAALLYMSDSDVEDMLHLYQWDGTIDEESTEENDTEEEAEEDEITIGSTVTVYGVEYVATQGPKRWGCTGCAGNRDQLCNKLPDCDGFIFVRNGE